MVNEKEYNGHKVKYSCMYEVQDENKLNKLISDFNKILDVELMVFVIFDTKSNITYEYNIMEFYTKKIIHNGILSLENDIMPRIQKRYCNENSQEKQIETIINKFSKAGYTLATMESCTGGGLANAITNVSGASDILHESYVAYCNEAKIKFGVSKEIIEKYTVYSLATAKAMANAVRITANSYIGIGITGQLGRIDPRNVGVENNKVWYAIKGPEKEISAEILLHIGDFSREDKKEIVIKEIVEDLCQWERRIMSQNSPSLMAH